VGEEGKRANREREITCDGDLNSSLTAASLVREERKRETVENRKERQGRPRPGERERRRERERERMGSEWCAVDLGRPMFSGLDREREREALTFSFIEKFEVRDFKEISKTPRVRAAAAAAAAAKPLPKLWPWLYG